MLKRAILLLLGLGCSAGSAQAQLTGERQMISMQDSVRLATYVYARGDTALPTVLIRTLSHHGAYAEPVQHFQDQGYNVVVQNIRGQFASEGNFALFSTDAWGDRRDGETTVSWIASQPWSQSRIGVFGYALDGYAAYLLAGANPQGLLAGYVVGAPACLYADGVYPQGAWRKHFVENWALALDEEWLIPATRGVPYYTYEWQAISLIERANEVSIPMTHVGGWYDAFVSGTLRAYNLLNETGIAEQKLVLGAWSEAPDSLLLGELVFPESAQFPILEDATALFDRWLKNDSTAMQNVPNVRYYIMGSDAKGQLPGHVWKQAESWPPKSESRKFYLTKNGGLSDIEMDPEGNLETIKYDPFYPLPTLGGKTVYLDPGPYDQRTVENRNDVLTFTTDSLMTAMTIGGKMQLQLFASSDRRDSDFTVRLTDVYPDGRSMLIAEGLIRLSHRNGSKAPQPLKRNEIAELNIDLGETALVIEAGHRLRLLISCSNAPKFQPHTNLLSRKTEVDEPPIALNSIYYGGKRPSHLELPIIPTPEAAPFAVTEE